MREHKCSLQVRYPLLVISKQARRHAMSAFFMRFHDSYSSFHRRAIGQDIPIPLPESSDYQLDFDRLRARLQGQRLSGIAVCRMHIGRQRDRAPHSVPFEVQICDNAPAWVNHLARQMR